MSHEIGLLLLVISAASFVLALEFAFLKELI